MAERIIPEPEGYESGVFPPGYKPPWADRKCEVCGEPATCFIKDMEQHGVSQDNYILLRSVGRHDVCKEHRREPTTKMLDGRVLTESEYRQEFDEKLAAVE